MATLQELQAEKARRMSAQPMANNDFQLTKLEPEEEEKFQNYIKGTGWHKEFQENYGEEPNLNDPEYDYRGAYKAGLQPERQANDQNRYHWSSKTPDGKWLKGPNHPTRDLELKLEALKAEKARRQSVAQPAQEAMPTEQPKDRYGRTAPEVQEMLGNQSAGERGLGMGLRAAAGGVAAPLDLLAMFYNIPVDIVNATFGTKVPTVPSYQRSAEALYDVATKDRYAPRTPSERISSEVASAAVSGGAGAIPGALRAGAKFVGKELPKAPAAFESLKEGAKGLFSKKAEDRIVGTANTLFEPTAANVGANAGGAFGGQASREYFGEDHPEAEIAASLLGGGLGAGAAQGVKPAARAFGKALPEAATETLEKKGAFIPKEEGFVQKTIKEAGLDTAATKEARELQRKTGIKLDLAEQSRNPMVRAIGDALANSTQISSFSERNAKRATEILKKTKDLVKDIGEKSNRTEFGRKVRDRGVQVLDDLIDMRSSIAKEDFKNLKGEIPLTNTEAAVDSIIKELDLPIQAPTVKGALSEAKGIKSQLYPESKSADVIPSKKGAFVEVPESLRQQAPIAEKEPEMLKVSGENLQQLLASFGKKGASSGSIFPDLDTAAKRRYSQIIFNGLQADLAAAAQAGGPDAQRLLKARDNYRILSQAIEKFENSYLNSIFGKDFKNTPEYIANVIGKKMEASQAEQLVADLKQFAPDLLADTQRFYIDNAIERARNLGVRQKTAFQREDVQARNLLGTIDPEIFSVLMGNSPKDKKIVEDLNNLLKVTDIINRFGVRVAGSQTAQRTEILKMINDENAGLPTSARKALEKIANNIINTFGEKPDQEKLYEVFTRPGYVRKLTKEPLTTKEVQGLRPKSAFLLRAGEAYTAGTKDQPDEE